MKKEEIIINVRGNCFLRILRENDISENYISWLNDYEITKYTEQRFYKHNFENVRNFVNDKFKSKNDFLFGIFYDDLHIGNVKLGPVKWEHKSTEVSYFIGNKNYWGIGIATDVVNSIVKFSINSLSLIKINAGYYETNIASAKLLEKCGFNVEGRVTSNIIFENRRIDLIFTGYIEKII